MSGTSKGKRSLLECHARCKYSMETTHKSINIKIDITVLKLASLIGLEVTVTEMSINFRERETSYW